MSEASQVEPEKAGGGTASFEQLTFLRGAFPVRIYPWPGIVADWLEKDPGSGLNFIASLSSSDRDWWLSKTYPVYCRPIVGRISPFCWPGYPAFFQKFLRRAGEIPDLDGVFTTTLLGEFWTLSTSEFPSGADVSLLSQVLEQEAPQKYYLSPKACAGILRRAAKRKKKLPPLLERSLQTVAAWNDQPETPTS